MDEVARRSLTHVTLGCFDWNGRFRSKHYNVRNLRKAMTAGTALTTAIFAPDTAERPIESGPFHDPANGYQDALMRALPETCRDLPFEADGRGMLLIGQLVDDYKAFCPRALLADEMERLHAIGYEALSAFEIECYLLRETVDTLAHKIPADVIVSPELARMYSFVDQAAEPAFAGDLETFGSHMGIGIDTLHPEFTGLLEIALTPGLGVTSADNAALFKSVSKVVAKRHGLMACYMARLSSQHESAGGHVNISLRKLDSAVPAFFDQSRAGHVSDTLRYFVGGLQRYIPELLILQCPHINSFKRFTPDSFSPKTNTWGINNKTAAYRVVNTDPTATRIEIRVPGADVNPYLSLLGCIAAGRRGIEERLEPTPPCTGNAWEERRAIGPEFPASFADALRCFQTSRFAREVCGDKFVSAYGQSRQWQLERYAQAVTDWELRTYAECV